MTALRVDRGRIAGPRQRCGDTITSYDAYPDAVRRLPRPALLATAAHAMRQPRARRMLIAVLWLNCSGTGRRGGGDRTAETWLSHTSDPLNGSVGLQDSPLGFMRQTCTIGKHHRDIALGLFLAAGQVRFDTRHRFSASRRSWDRAEAKVGVGLFQRGRRLRYFHRGRSKYENRANRRSRAKTAQSHGVERVLASSGLANVPSLITQTGALLYQYWTRSEKRPATCFCRCFPPSERSIERAAAAKGMGNGHDAIPTIIACSSSGTTRRRRARRHAFGSAGGSRSRARARRNQRSNPARRPAGAA